MILAEFAFAVDAFFSSNRDISAPDSAITPPPEAFPSRRAAINPFFPFILETLPPNTDDLVEPETDALVSVIGGTAVFERGGELRQLRAGDRVYLGRIATWTRPGPAWWSTTTGAASASASSSTSRRASGTARRSVGRR